MLSFSRGVLITALVAGLGFASSAMAQDINKSEVEKIIEDYIMNNPQVILQSVNDYQTEGVAQQQQAGITSNTRKIFQNEMSPIAGNPNGDITVVEFFDYNCGYCKRVVDDLNKLAQTDENVKIIYKEFPILGPTSETAARWALAAANQDKYIPFHTALMKYSGRIDESVLERIGKDLSLDVEKLRTEAQSDTITDYLAENRQLAQELSITGTPGFIIEDEIYPGAVQYDTMTEIIAEKRAEKADNKAED
jgi:protein-disulfide isomerase